MGFKLISDSNKAPVIWTLLATNSEAIADGEALKFASGRLTKATGNAAVACVAVGAVAAGTDQPVKVIIVEPGQIWEVGYSGTPDAGFIVGCASADLDSAGTGLNAADVTSGCCGLLEIDSTNAKAKVIFTNRVFG